MAQEQSPNVGSALLAIHHVISRAIAVSLENSNHFAKAGFPDTPTRAGFANYVQSLVTCVRAHHLTEDEVVFPEIRKVIPDAPYDLLASEHKILEPLLPALGACIQKIEQEANSPDALRELPGLLLRLSEVWHPHIQKEEQNFSMETLARCIDPPEHLRLIKLFSEHSQKFTEPAFLIVPFILFNLPAEERAAFSKAFPPVVIEQLVPVVWKEKWESMKPFLLS